MLAMGKASLAAIVRYCDRVLQTSQFKDWDGAANGLQVENHGRVTRIAAAVDGSVATVESPGSQGRSAPGSSRSFLGAQPSLDRPALSMLRLLMENDLAVYSSHLPLDAHPVLGNNAQLSLLSA